MNGERDEAPGLTKDQVSDDVLKLLYVVVERAQTVAPSRTLLETYNEILGARRIEPYDDGVMRQMLSRLAVEKRVGERLLDRFRRVCADLDINIEVNEDGSGVEITTELESTSLGEAPVPRPTYMQRRSFDSLLDQSADKIAGSIQDLPIRSRSSSGEAHPRDQVRRPKSDPQGYSQPAELPYRPRVNPNPYAAINHEAPDMRESGFPDDVDANYDAYESDHTAPTAEFDLSNLRIPGVNAPYPEAQRKASPPRRSPPGISRREPEPFRPSDTRLLDDAETFEQQRLYTVARRCLYTWLELTRERIRRREVAMNQLATAMDRRSLLKGVLSTLQQEVHNRQSNRETDRFFGRLEGRAARARNLFLLTKAFTHWAKSAEDEVQRTSVARRHILRTRFFNGWREITAVNELKIQHFVLGRFLDKWLRRTAEVRENRAYAEQLYNESLLRKCYKSWFWRFCDVAAPAWHDAHLKRVAFRKWREVASVNRERDVQTTDRRNQQVQRKMLVVWQQKTTAFQSMEDQADTFRRRHCMLDAIRSLRKQTQFNPLLSRLQTSANTRRLRSAVQIWRQSTTLSRQAKDHDRMRITRNAWTGWNDQLRVQALRERINDRVLVETMYRWALASRLSLFQRVHNRNLQESMLLTWVTKMNERGNMIERMEARFAHFKRTQLLRTYLRKIEAATAEKRAEVAAVTAQYDIKLKQRLFNTLLDKYAHLQQLNRWAEGAQFYVMTTHALQRWGNATQQSRRIKRREAYAQMRRTLKLNLVRKTLAIWQEKANVIAQQRQQAEQIARDRTLQNARVILTFWRDRLEIIFANDALAMGNRNVTLQAQQLRAWMAHFARLEDMDAQAISFYELGSNVVAAKAFDRMAWARRLMEKRKGDALELHEYHFEKHRKAMLKYWIKSTRERLAARSASPSPAARSRERSDEPTAESEHDQEREDADGPSFDADNDNDNDNDNDSAGDDTQRLEAWTAFDAADLNLTLALTPQTRQQRQRQVPRSQQRTQRSQPPLSRPKTFPPHSALRSAFRPPPIPEDLVFDDPSAFFTSTPMPPSKRIPGYRQTPSKREAVREMRGGVGVIGSPEKRRRVAFERGGVGAMSAPVARTSRTVELDAGGVKSFGRRMREGGYGRGLEGEEEDQGWNWRDV